MRPSVVIQPHTQCLFLIITLILPAIPITALIYLQDTVAFNEYIGVVLGLPDRWIEVLGTLEVQFLFYWVPGGILFYLHEYLSESIPTEATPDIGSASTSSPQHAPQEPGWYRLPFRYRRIPHSKLSGRASTPNIPTQRMLQNVFLNHVYILLMYAFLLTLVPSPFTHTAATFPSLFKIASDTVFAVLLGDLLTYLLHRKFHTSPFIYKHIHGMHHKYRESNALAAHYVHPLEAVLMNWMCIWLPIAVMGWVGKYSQIGARSTSSWGYFGFSWINEGVHVVEWFVLWSGVLFWSVVVHGGVEPVWVESIESHRGGNKPLDKSEIDDSGVKPTPKRRREVQGNSTPRWNLLKRHDLHHEVGGGAGRVISSEELKGRPRRWGNFAPFWWLDAVFGTEIECMNQPEEFI